MCENRLISARSLREYSYVLWKAVKIRVYCFYLYKVFALLKILLYLQRDGVVCFLIFVVY